MMMMLLRIVSNDNVEEGERSKGPASSPSTNEAYTQRKHSPGPDITR